MEASKPVDVISTNPPPFAKGDFMVAFQQTR